MRKSTRILTWIVGLCFVVSLITVLIPVRGPLTAEQLVYLLIPLVMLWSLVYGLLYAAIALVAWIRSS